MVQTVKKTTEKIVKEEQSYALINFYSTHINSPLTKDELDNKLKALEQDGYDVTDVMVILLSTGKVFTVDSEISFILSAVVED